MTAVSPALAAAGAAPDENTATAAGPSATSVPHGVVPERRRGDWMTDPLEKFKLYSARGLIDPSLTLESLRVGQAVRVKPIASRGMDPLARQLLSSAFPLAITQLSKYPQCRGLYEELGTDGLLALMTTVYVSPSAAADRQICLSLDAVAYTRVGEQTTFVCPSFVRLSRARAAATLLHEALHYAGLAERPGNPAARSSAEITALVRGRCAL